MLFNFDYDGVIVDSFDQLLCLAVQAQQALGGGRKPIGEDFQKIENLAFDELGRRIGLDEDTVSQYAYNIFELQRDQWEVDVFSEMIPALERLAKLHQLVVITSSQSEAVATTLEDFGIRSLFSDILGGELGMTKAACIKQSCHNLSCFRKDTFMVGDAISDIRQGKVAGVKTISVSWGFQDRALLEKEDPDFIAGNPSDLLKIGA